MSRSEFSSIREMSFPQGETASDVSPAREGLRKTFALMDVKGMIVYVDPVMALKFGGDPQSLSGKHISTLIPGERLGALVRRVAKTGTPQKVPGAWLPSGSNTGPGKNEHYLLPITTDSGKVTGVVFCRVARSSGDPAPTSGRSGKKFKTLFDSISIPILIVHKNGTVLECNRAACEYLGLGGDDLPGMTLYDLTWSGWFSTTADGIDNAGKNGRSRFEIPLRGIPDERGLSEISLRRVEYGNEGAFLAEIREAPVRPAVFAELERERWRALLAALPVAAFLWRKQRDGFRLDCWNTAAAAVTGGAAAGWRGKSADGIRIGGIEAGMILARAETGGDFRVETEAFDGGGGMRRARITAGPVPGGLVLVCIEEIDTPEERERSLRELKAGLKSISEEMTLAEERERLRIAADIHDGVSQILAAAHFQLEELEAGMLPGEARALAGRIREHVMRAIHSTRSLSFGLCPPVLRERGLETAAEWLAGRFQKDHGIPVRFSSDGKVDRLEWHLELLLFKILGELLQNVGKHARAKRVQVFLRKVDGRVQVTVEDDGIGFDPSKTKTTEREGGFGLHSIRERLRYVGGECAVDSALCQGTRCTVNIPIGNCRQP